MKHPLRLCLLVAALAVAPPAVPAENARKYQPPRRSHVPIEGGISPADADAFLRDRLEQAETMAGLQRLITDLAEHPERHGIDTPGDRETLKRALRDAGGQPEKALEDREVRRIIREAAGKLQNQSEASPEERRRWEDLAHRFLPPEGAPLGTWPTGENPNDPSQPPPAEPKPPPDGGPPNPMRPPEAAPGIVPAPQPPAIPGQPANSPVKDRLRDMAEALADSRLGESPAFRRLVANIDRVKAPEAGVADWNRRLDKLESRFTALGTPLPKISWPQIEHAPRDPVGKMAPAAGEPGAAAREGRQLLLVLLAAGTAGLFVWALLRRKGLLVLRRGNGGWRLGPWPVRPEAVRTREELVRAFEYLALLLLGPASRSCNHRDIAAGLGAEDDTRRAAAERLADLYEQARYAPPDEELPESNLAAARADLSLLAGVAAA